VQLVEGRLPVGEGRIHRSLLENLSQNHALDDDKLWNKNEADESISSP